MEFRNWYAVHFHLDIFYTFYTFFFSPIRLINLFSELVRHSVKNKKETLNSIPLLSSLIPVIKVAYAKASSKLVPVTR